MSREVLIPPNLAEAAAVLDSPPPAVTTADAEAVAAAYFGVAGTASVLTAERDCNFRLVTADGDWLLKVSNPVEADAAIEAQTLALLHLAAADPALPVPRVRRTLAGETILRWQGLRVRMLSYLPGLPLHLVPASVARSRSIGALLGRLALALREFDHPGTRRPILWDITGAAGLAPLLPLIDDPARRDLAARFLDGFRRHAAPALPGLRHQALHNDFNPHNLLADQAAPGVLAGIIDFGDLVHAAQVNDVATAAAYDVPEDGHPLAYAGALVGAYHAVNPLRAEEVDILFDLIAVRQVVSVTVNSWRAQLYPANRDYIMRNSQVAWRGLGQLAAVDRTDARSWFRNFLGMT